MSKNHNNISIWERILSREIGIEFKACLYFLCILCFYSVYHLLGGHYEASILHMTEMICLTYVMGYLQVYLLSNFDEAMRLGLREILYMLLCSGIYMLCSIFCKWFDGNLLVIAVFTIYMILIYLFTFLIYKLKREIDEKLLNEDLRAFQKRR